MREIQIYWTFIVMLYNFWFWKFYCNTNLLCAFRKKTQVGIYQKEANNIWASSFTLFCTLPLRSRKSRFFYLLYLPLRYIPDDECHYFLILLLRCRFLESFLKDKSIVLMKSIQIYSIVVFQKGSFSSLLELLRVFLQ